MLFNCKNIQTASFITLCTSAQKNNLYFVAESNESPHLCLFILTFKIYSQSIHLQIIGPNTPLFWGSGTAHSYETFVISKQDIYRGIVIHIFPPVFFPGNSQSLTVNRWTFLQFCSFFFNLLFAMQQNSFKYRNHFCMKVPIIFWAQCQSKKCARIPVLYSPVSLVFRDQAVCSNATATLIHDNPPAVREYFTPFPISARAESCCYRNIDLNNLNTVDFLICTWLKIYTTFLREFLFWVGRSIFWEVWKSPWMYSNPIKKVSVLPLVEGVIR